MKLIQKDIVEIKFSKLMWKIKIVGFCDAVLNNMMNEQLRSASRMWSRMKVKRVVRSAIIFIKQLVEEIMDIEAEKRGLTIVSESNNLMEAFVSLRTLRQDVYDDGNEKKMVEEDEDELDDEKVKDEEELVEEKDEELYNDKDKQLLADKNEEQTAKSRDDPVVTSMMMGVRKQWKMING